VTCEDPPLDVKLASSARAIAWLESVDITVDVDKGLILIPESVFHRWPDQWSLNRMKTIGAMDHLKNLWGYMIVRLPYQWSPSPAADPAPAEPHTRRSESGPSPGSACASDASQASPAPSAAQSGSSSNCA
jgi:hypothetical protein